LLALAAGGWISGGVWHGTAAREGRHGHRAESGGEAAGPGSAAQGHADQILTGQWVLAGLQRRSTMLAGHVRRWRSSCSRSVLGAGLHLERLQSHGARQTRRCVSVPSFTGIASTRSCSARRRHCAASTAGKAPCATPCEPTLHSAQHTQPLALARTALRPSHLLAAMCRTTRPWPSTSMCIPRWRHGERRRALPRPRPPRQPPRALW
jgi:hypothetical protein